MNGMMSVSKYK